MKRILFILFGFTSFIIFFGVSRSIVNAQCGDGQFCGLDQGYDATVSQNVKYCFRNGTTWECSNTPANDFWLCDGSFPCSVAGGGGGPGGNCSYVGDVPSCSLNVTAGGCPADPTACNGCDIDLVADSCDPISVPVYTGCCVGAGGECSSESEAGCNSGQNVGDSCGGGSICIDSGSEGGDGKPICNCGGGGNEINWLRARIMLDANENNLFDEGDEYYVQDNNILSCSNLANNYVTFTNLSPLKISPVGFTTIDVPTICHLSGENDNNHPKFPWAIEQLNTDTSFTFNFTLPASYELVNVDRGSCSVSSPTQVTCSGWGGGIQEVTFLIRYKRNTCTVSVSPATDNSVPGSTTVTLSGTNYDTNPADTVNLNVIRNDFKQVPNWQTSITPNSPAVTETLSNGVYYYKIPAAGCTSSNGTACSKTTTVNLPAADYTFFCDVPYAPFQCSGNPNCTYEGGTMDCSGGGWVSCSESDHTPFSVYLQCPSNRTSVCDGTGTSVTTSWTNFSTNDADSYYHELDDNPNSSPYVVTNSATSPLTQSVIAGTPYRWEIRGNRTNDDTEPLPVGPTGGCWISFTCNPPAALPWWRVTGSGITANGFIQSTIPAAGMYLINDPPGVLQYNNDNPPSLGLGSISSTGWNVNLASAHTYTYDFFRNKLPSSVTPTQLTNCTIAAANLTIGGMEWPAGSNYFWYETTCANSSITIGSLTDISINLLDRKVILFAKDKVVNITKPIFLNNGKGFFGLFTSNDISVASSVGGLADTSPDLEGIFFTEGDFKSGVGNYGEEQLHVRGSVAANTFTLAGQRNLPDDSADPAEHFEFAPDLIFNFPKVLSPRLINWKEVAP